MVPVELIRADERVQLKALLDTGASDCLFDIPYADILGIDLRMGFDRSYRTVAGSFRAFGP